MEQTLFSEENDYDIDDIFCCKCNKMTKHKFYWFDYDDEVYTNVCLDCNNVIWGD